MSDKDIIILIFGVFGSISFLLNLVLAKERFNLRKDINLKNEFEFDKNLRQLIITGNKLKMENRKLILKTIHLKRKIK